MLSRVVDRRFVLGTEEKEKFRTLMRIQEHFTGCRVLSYCLMVMTEAERLSASHSESLGTCSLDILHVAAALVLGSEVFLTFDTRQSSLAKAAGLKVKPL
jgi:predicted nucleic acid-binding protein